MPPQFVDGREVKWMEYGPVKDLRGVTTVTQKPLLRVDDGGPGDFDFAIVRTEEGQAVNRHNHNWSQIIYVLEGAYNYAPGKDQKAGDVGYIAEGTFYGPQDNTSFTNLVLQFGGTSGHGYPGHERIRRAVQEMSKLGKFTKGVFERTNEAGNTVRQEAGKAVLSHILGSQVTYPPEQYREPIWMVPANFPWKSSQSRSGTQTRHLGAFSNGGVEIQMIRVEKGADYFQGGDDRRHLLFIEEGELESSETILGTQSAVYTAEREEITFRAVTNWHGMLITLPSFF